MIPFQIEIRNGAPVSEQVVYAVKKAVISGRLGAGAKFPSVRALSQELRINPNTSHKIIAALIQEGLLEVQPGIGTVVAGERPGTARQRAELLGASVERLVVEAKNLRLELKDVESAVAKQWKKLSQGGKET